MMALALALVIAAVVVRVTVGSESRRYGLPSPADEPVRQRKWDAKEDAKEPVAAAFEPERSNSRSELPQPASQQTPSGRELQPQQNQTQPQEKPLPAAEDNDWAKPTQEELHSANAARHYELLPGAIMGLSIRSMGIYNAPVFDSASRSALAKGISHIPQTSLPWSQGAQRNVYLAGHRMGYRGTWSRMIFYNLDKLQTGDKVVLKDRAGTSYRYRVSEVLVVDPTDSWVMGQVRGRDMVTLQTCTPYPTFEKRLIVRADRV